MNLPYHHICRLFTIAIASLLAISCINDLFPGGNGPEPKPEPVVKQSKVSFIGYDNVRVDGIIMNSSSAKSTGIFYGEKEDDLSNEINVKCSESGEFSVNIASFKPGTRYYYKVVAKVTKKDVIAGPSGQFITFTKGPVDLGLPSGIKWASSNLDATLPTDVGGYYAWGETETKKYYDWYTYSFCINGDYERGMTKYVGQNDYGNVPDNKTELELSDDAAHVILGGKWRIPTSVEITELIQNCAVSRAEINGVSGYKFISKKTMDETNFIFFPSFGYMSEGAVYGNDPYIWSSTAYQGLYTSIYAYYGNMNSYASLGHSGYRKEGYQIRPVCE